MATKEIRVSIGDLDRNGSPDVNFEFYDIDGTEKKGDERPVYLVIVSSSNNDGKYDTITPGMDIDGDGVPNEVADKVPFLRFANSFAKFLK